MITGAIAIVFGIAMYVCAGNGEWGAFAVGAVIVVIVLAIGSESRKCDRAFNNFVDHWADGNCETQKRVSGMARRTATRKRCVVNKMYSGDADMRKRIESETLKARYAPIERSEAYKEAIARKQAEKR